MTVVNQILSRLDNINKPQHKFLQVLFATILTVHSAINFLFTFKKFAKTYLKIKQKTRKQRTKIKT
jgi:hypothetical protein